MKEKLTIKEIGKLHFWLGIFVGIFSTILLNYFYFYSRESLRLFTSFHDLSILPEMDVHMLNLFFTALSCSLSMGFTMVIWLKGLRFKYKRRYQIDLGVSLSIWLNFLILFCIGDFGSTLYIVLCSSRGYHEHLDFVSYYWIVLLLIPVIVYFIHWNTIQRLYRSRKWINYSILISIGFVLVNFLWISSISRPLDVYDKNQNGFRYEYIEKQFQQSKEDGIYFDEETRKILQKRYAEETTKLVYDLKRSFERGDKIPLDSLILKKILVHNCNTLDSRAYKYRKWNGRFWPYARPFEIQNQMLMHDKASKEYEVLEDILALEYDILNTPEIDYRKKNEYSKLELARSIILRNSRGYDDLLLEDYYKTIDSLGIE